MASLVIFGESTIWKEKRTGADLSVIMIWVHCCSIIVKMSRMDDGIMMTWGSTRSQSDDKTYPVDYPMDCKTPILFMPTLGIPDLLNLEKESGLVSSLHWQCAGCWPEINLLMNIFL